MGKLKKNGLLAATRAGAANPRAARAVPGLAHAARAGPGLAHVAVPGEADTARQAKPATLGGQLPPTQCPVLRPDGWRRVGW
jgi:hypothetical protein